MCLQPSYGVYKLKPISADLDITKRNSNPAKFIPFLHSYKLIGSGGSVSIPTCLKISNLLHFVVMM